LAAAGYIGSEFASADEVVIAVNAQEAKGEGKQEAKSEGKKEPEAKKPEATAKNTTIDTNKGEANKPEAPTNTTTQPTKLSLPGLPDLTKAGWERTEVPKALLPYAERLKPIKWIDLIVDTVKLQGKKRVLTGAQYLHVVQKWEHALAQLPEVQAVIKAALEMRKRIKEALAKQGEAGAVA
jgi:hypothetical protein